MKAQHKQHRPRHKKISNFLRSWWLGVTVLSVFVVGIAVFQKFSTSAKTSVSGTNNPGTLSFGVALGASLNEADNSKRSAVLGQIKHAGFNEVRITLDWDKAEPTQGKKNWTHADSLMKAVRKSGLKTVMLVNTSPVWARLETCKASSSCPPQTPADYASFVAAAATRYKNYDISAWEIWNEENGNNFWKPQPNPEQYARLLKASYSAIKKSDSKAIVLIGGLSGDSVDLIGPNLIDPRTYLTKLYTAGAAGHFDGIAYHPYITDLGLPTKKGAYNGWAKMGTSDNSIRSILLSHGDGDKNIWITEFGIPTGGSGPVVTDPHAIPPKADHASLDAQAELVQSFMDDLKRSPWVRNFDWYSYKDDTTASTYSGAAYGIWQLDGKPKPMLRILQKAMTSNNP